MNIFYIVFDIPQTPINSKRNSLANKCSAMLKSYVIYAYLVLFFFISGNTFGQSCGTITWTDNSIDSFQSCGGINKGFNANGDYSYTSIITNPQSLTFDKKRSNNTTAWSMDIQISPDGGALSWTTIATINSISNTCGTENIDLSSYTGTRRIRFIDTRSSGTHERAISNIVITCATYTVTYDGNGSDGGTVPTDASSPYFSGSTVTVLGAGTMTKTGNTFAGWDSDNDGTANFTGSGSETFSISANTTLYAQWTPSGCTTQTINPIASSVTKTYGDVAYSVATTATSSLTVTYSSSNTSVATVDASGNVTIVGAGTATITAAQAGNSSYCAATSLTQALTVNKKNLTITGLTANDKLYDGTTTTTLNGTATLNGVLAGDASNVSLGGAPSVNFNDATMACSKTVTVSGYTISGSASSNYSLTQPSGFTACINGISTNNSTTLGPFCNFTSNTIALPYTVVGSFAGQYDIQISNSSGTFPTNATTQLLTYVSNSGGIVTATLPASYTTGTKYRVRVVNSSPAFYLSGNNGSDFTITAVATPTLSITSSPAAVAGTTTICSGTNVTFTATPASVGGGTVSYQWKLNGTNVGTNSNSYSNNTLATGNTITCDITITGGCVTATSASSNTITMAVNTTPTNDLCSNAVGLTANAAAVGGTMTPCAGFETPFSGSKKDVWYKFVAPCTADYTIILTGFTGDMDMALFYNSNSCPSSTTTIASSTTSTSTETITQALTSGNTYYIRVYAFNTTAESSSFTIQATGITSVPAQPDPIVGETSVCPGSSQTYTTNPVADATSYTWSIPSGWNITAGAGTTSITVTTGISGGTVSVTADNGCGSSTARNLAVSMLAIPSTPTATAGTAITGASFTANWNSVGGITDYSVDVYTYSANQNMAVWTFPTSGATTTADIYNANNNGKTITRQGGGSITDVSGATTKAANGNGGWDGGSGSKYWQIIIDATDSKNLTLSSKQYSSNTGPRDWKVQYKIGSSGTWTDITSGNITVANNFTTGVLTNLALPSACDFQPELYIRWIMTSNTQADGGGSVASGGTSRIDDIYVNGDMFSYVPGYENIITSGTSLAVTGLSPNTDYYYVVRADNGNCVSPNSNDIKVTTSSCVSATHTVTSIMPNTGPVGTRVLIRGTGFTSITDVQIGGISFTDYTIVDNTTIIARIPDGATTSTIDVFNNGCPKSSGTFTLLSSVGLCGGAASATPTDLLISEVYDSETGSRGYIELYNGTASTINLANYKIKISTGATNWVSLSGSLAPNKFAIVKIGSTGTDCGTSITTSGTLVIDRNSSSGYNENDPIELYKGNTTKIDRMVTPNEKGFNMERNTLTDAPSTTFTSANWTKNSTETCSTLGYASFATAPLLVINTSATDWTTCPGTVQFTVSATATPAPISSYTWYYNDFNLMNGWQLVSGNITGATGTNTATLTLPADFAPLYNYQFYCDINKTNSGNSCTKATNAAYFTYPTAPYYRTKASTTNGSWTTANEWEMTTDINFVSPAPITACAYPLSVNSSAAFIQNGTKTTIGDGVSSYVIDIDKITIDGTLELHKKSSLFVYDSTAGADMIVNGTLIDRGSSSNGIAFTGASYLSGSGWTMGSAATVIKTNNASVDEYKTHYQDGISTIPDGSAGANWIYQYNGDGNPSVNAIGMFYPNLIFENTTGAAYSFITSTSLLKGGSDYCTVKGNFNIGTTGTNPVTVYNNNFNTQAMKVLGNLSIGTGSILSNASYDGNTSVNHGHGTGIELSGNLTNDGTFTNNSNSIGILRFKGTGTQIVSGAGTFNLYNVELDKPSQTLVDQQVNLTAQNNLNFNAGGILKTNSNVFSVNNGSITNAVTGHDAPYTGLASPTYSNDKYIFGRLERMVNTNGIYDFPVGDAVAGEGYNPIRFERISGTGNATAWFIPGDPGSINVGPVSVSCTRDNFYHFTDMTGEGKWRMSGASFNYNIYLHPNQNNNNVHPNELGTNYPYFYRNNYRTLKATDGTTDWTPFAGDGNICVVGSYYNCPGTNFSGFSDFAIPGGDGLSTALPIELVSFTAKCIENEKVQLHWITASERNSANFIIEKSLDAIHFYPIGTVQAAGNSISELHYQFIDELPNDKAYYRLKQIDLDNKENIHPVIYTKCGLTINGIQVYYAGNNQIHADIQTNKTEDYIFNLYQTDGKLIFHHSKVILEGKSKVILSHNQLAKGIYLLQVINGENMQTKKIVVD